ncbi:hypothetical protein V6N12_040489 [Hibiscus sabdariffa]|uniref:Uncharacterized protein n=1 Tax=Hibiscus sabdariffa TaxID=183260 RepID=A0ABR2E3V7_9ROSI
MMIMKLCPNLANEEGLDTVLEVPIPEEMYTKMGSNEILRWQNMRKFMKARSSFDSSSYLLADSDNEFLTLLKLVGAPLIPFRVDLENYTRSSPITYCSIVSYNTSHALSIYVYDWNIEYEDCCFVDVRTGSLQCTGTFAITITICCIGYIVHLVSSIGIGPKRHSRFKVQLKQKSPISHVQFEDKKLVRMKAAVSNDSVESLVEDYRYVDGVNIAHSGKTITTLSRFGKLHKHNRQIEETWWIDEVEFNIRGLSSETFLPPAVMSSKMKEERLGTYRKRNQNHFILSKLNGKKTHCCGLDRGS